jgi:GTP-binding protein HflX
VPEVLAFNKSDLAPEAAKRLAEREEGSVAFSAVTGEGVDALLETVSGRLRALTRVVDVVIPYDRGDLIAAAHRSGEVLEELPGEGGMRLRARFDEASMARFREYVVS